MYQEDLKEKAVFRKKGGLLKLAPLCGLIWSHLLGTYARGESYSYCHSTTANGQLTFAPRELNPGDIYPVRKPRCLQRG